MKREPTEIERNSQQRIIQLISQFCDGSQQIFADKVGIGKSSVSQYVNGTNFPTNVRAAQIADYFKVSPMWVMGFDVPMHEEKEKGGSYYYSEETAKLAQELYEDKDMQMLIAAARDCSPEDLQMAANFLKRLKRKLDE